MTSLETRPSSNPRFVLKNENAGTDRNDRFLIRPESPVNRARAIAEFDAEENRPQASSRPGVATLLESAEILLKAGEKSTAAHLVRQALCLDSRDPEALKKMLRCLGDREWEIPQRDAILKTLVETEPTFENFARLGQALIDRGDLDSALEALFEASMRATDENELLFDVFKNLGNIYVRKGDFESAEESYHKAFTLNPDSDVLQVNLATLSVQRQDWESARERFTKALEINPLNDKAWVGLGLCHHQVGDSLLAQANLENALDICPSNRTAAHLMASWSLPSGPVARAIERVQEYLSTQEADVEMSLVLIHLFCHRQLDGLARIELERALLWAPDREDLLQLRDRLTKSEEAVD